MNSSVIKTPSLYTTDDFFRVNDQKVKALCDFNLNTLIAQYRVLGGKKPNLVDWLVSEGYVMKIISFGEPITKRAKRIKEIDPYLLEETQ